MWRGAKLSSVEGCMAVEGCEAVEGCKAVEGCRAVEGCQAVEGCVAVEGGGAPYNSKKLISSTRFGVTRESSSSTSAPSSPTGACVHEMWPRRLQLGHRR